MAALQRATSYLSQVFLSPEMFLFGLLAIPVVLLLYFVRKRPEEEVMPSMMFFMEEEGDSSASAALRFLRRNLMLLLHLFLVLGFAAAAAEPFFEDEEVPESAVVILDVSASMQDDMSEARQFALDNLGRTNTVILAGESPRVVGDKVSRGRASSLIRGAEATGEKTDVVAALDRASALQGSVVLASDGDQSTDRSSAEARAEALRDAGRKVLVPQLDEGGQRHAITGVSASPDSFSAEVANLAERPRNITVTSGNTSRTLSLLSGASASAEFPVSIGTQVASLPEDDVPADNTAYVSYPEDEQAEVVHISNGGDRFLETAVRQISFTEYQKVEPPLDSVPRADIYVVGRTDRVLSESINDIEDRTADGGGLVVIGREGLRPGRYDSLDVSGVGELEKADVEVREPVRASVSNTSVLGFSSARGSSLSRPRRALLRFSHGDGEVLLFNMNSSDFGPSFVYPVFWKRLFQDMVERREIPDLNRDTGAALNSTRIEMPSGQERSGFVRMRSPGIYNTSNGLYAANLESRDESVDEADIPPDRSQSRTVKTERNLQSVAAVALAVLVLGELAALRRLGEL